MSIWFLLCNSVEVLFLPIVGLTSLIFSKLTSGSAARLAERWFFGILLAVTLITCHTVLMHNRCWFSHTSTLGMMIVGSLLFPNRDGLVQRRVQESWQSIG